LGKRGLKKILYHMFNAFICPIHSNMCAILNVLHNLTGYQPDV